jgi:hypothetical protein
VRVIEKVPFGERGQGTLVRLQGRPNWFSILWHAGRQVEFSTGTADLKLARKFHKAKLEQLVLDKHGTPSSSSQPISGSKSILSWTSC